MGNLTDKINSMLRELQEVSDTINGVERRPLQVQYPQSGQPRVGYGAPGTAPGQQVIVRNLDANGGRAAYPAQISFQPQMSEQPDANADAIKERDLAAAHAEANNPYRHVPHDTHDSRANPINLSAFDGNPLMQGIILSEVLGRPVSRRPRGLGRRV